MWFDIFFELPICRFLYLQVLSSIINMIAEDWLTLKLKAERDVMIKHVRTVRLLMSYVSIAFISGFVLIIIVPYFNVPLRLLTNLTDRNKPLPLQTYYLYDTDKSPQFEFTFLSQALTIFEGLIIHIGVHAFLIFMIFHIYGQLANLKNRVVHLFTCKDFNKALSSIVITHLRLIR